MYGKSAHRTRRKLNYNRIGYYQNGKRYVKDFYGNYQKMIKFFEKHNHKWEQYWVVRNGVRYGSYFKRNGSWINY